MCGFFNGKIFFFFFSKAISSLRDSMIMFDDKPDGSRCLDPVPRSVTGAAIYLGRRAGCWRPPRSCGRAGGAGRRGPSGFLPIWMEQVRGCISTRQLWSWHAPHCLLTVIFLQDFIKTPSVVRADKESKQKRGAGRGRRERARPRPRPRAPRPRCGTWLRAEATLGPGGYL